MSAVNGCPLFVCSKIILRYTVITDSLHICSDTMETVYNVYGETEMVADILDIGGRFITKSVPNYMTSP